MGQDCLMKNMTREQLELEYLELCDVLEREPTQQNFEQFRKDPQMQQQIRQQAKEVEQRTFTQSEE